LTDDDSVAVPPSGTSTDLLSVSQDRRGGAVIVRFTGEIDLSSVPSVRAAVTAALADATPPDLIVLDLTGVGFLASAGLAELQLARQLTADQHIPLRIVATSRVVLRPLEVIGMAATLDIRPDVGAALAPPYDAVNEQRAL